MGINDCKMLDWKGAVEKILKPQRQWHLKFMESKRKIIKRCRKDNNNTLIRGEVFYKSDLGTFRSVCQRGKINFAGCHN